jgi:hypothetical protein
MGKELNIMKMEKKNMREIILMINMKEKEHFILKMEIFILGYLKMVKKKEMVL